MKKGLVLATSLFVLGMQCGVQANFTDNFRSEYGKELCLEYVEVYDINKKNIDPQGPGFIYSRQGKKWFSMCFAPVYDCQFKSSPANVVDLTSIEKLLKPGHTEFLGYETVTEHQLNMLLEFTNGYYYPYRGIEILRYDVLGMEDKSDAVDVHNGIRWHVNENSKIGKLPFDLYTIKNLLTGEMIDKNVKFLASGKQELFGETFVVEQYALNLDESVASLNDKKMKMMGMQNMSAKSYTNAVTSICRLYYRESGELAYFTSFGRDVELPKETGKLKARSLEEAQKYLNTVIGVIRPRYYQVTDVTKKFDVDSYDELKSCTLKTSEEAKTIIQNMFTNAKVNKEREEKRIQKKEENEALLHGAMQALEDRKQSKQQAKIMKIRQAPLERRIQRIKKK